MRASLTFSQARWRPYDALITTLWRCPFVLHSLDTDFAIAIAAAARKRLF